MNIVHSSQTVRDTAFEPVVALGNFDGVTLAHQSLLQRTVELARKRGGTATVLTFEPHPLSILAPESVPPLLTVFSKKTELIEEMGIDLLVCEKFTHEFARQSPREFVQTVLVDGLGAKEVVTGFDYGFGHAREGTVTTLRTLGEELGFLVHSVEPVYCEGQLVSSSRVREWIQQGLVESAAQFLGRPYSIRGPVVRGTQTGGKHGVPTANVDPGPAQVPGRGVYAVYLDLEGQTFPGVINIGVNPTFGRNRLSIEVHILDFEGDIYGKEVEVLFIGRLRDEIRFPSPQALVEQIRKDIESTKTLLASHPL